MGIHDILLSSERGSRFGIASLAPRHSQGRVGIRRDDHGEHMTAENSDYQSDWTGTYSTTEALQAGLDLEMPGPAVWRGSRVKAAVFAGKLKEEVVNDRARAVLGVSAAGLA